MIHEGTDITPETTLEADVVVIGSGAGGAVVAAELAEAGRKVVILEEGGSVRARDMNQREDDMLARFTSRRGPEWNRDHSVSFARDKGVGGTTLSYWAVSLQAPEDRIQRWAEEFRIHDFSMESLAPHFERTGRKSGVRAVADHVINENDRRFAAAAERLGWHVPRIERAARGCVGSGFCQLGCFYRAKGLNFSYVQRGLRAGLEVFADCRAERFVMDGGEIKEVIAAVVDRETGKPRHQIRAHGKLFVVACGGLGTPSLLLQNGVGGPIGRTLYWNPHVPVYCLYGEPIYSYAGVPCAHQLDEFRLARTNPDGSYKEGGYTVLCGFTQPGGFGVATGAWGTRLQTMLDNYPRMGGAISVIDDEEPGSVSLGPKGERVIDVRLGPRDKLKVRDYCKKAATLFLAAGASEVYIPDAHGTTIRGEADLARIDDLPLDPHTIMLNATHLMGTCPMGEHPERSAVSSYGRSHAVSNLFVADASVLPTSLSAPPAWTIMAIASRTAEYIAYNWRRLTS
jgi:choline dehydrogenase-like flavoprotein